MYSFHVDMIVLRNNGQRYLGARSSGSGSGYDSGEGYNGYKKDESITCIINNNNINNNFVNGNATNGNGNGNETDACENCFSNLTSMQFNRLLTVVEVTPIGDYCDRLDSIPNSLQETQSVVNALLSAGANLQQIAGIIECLVDLGLISPPTEICGNFLDDDFDGLIDCVDPGCASLPTCMMGQ
jgi:hypothetical protein